jgi:hypothetical protein
MPFGPHSRVGSWASSSRSWETVARGYFTFPQGRDIIAPVPFDLVPLRVLGIERLRGADADFVCGIIKIVHYQQDEHR